MQTADVHGLREAFFSAEDDYTKLLAFSRLSHSPEATWNDLLEGLRIGGSVSQHAAIRLHVLLKVPRQLDGIVMSIDFWESQLESLGIGKSDRIRRDL
jgi:hypothetical protein